MNTSYHYLIMAQQDLLENQCIEEILREKTNFYSIRKKQRDFWLSISPNFLYSPDILNSLKLTKFYQQKKNTFSKNLDNSLELNFFCSLISLDKEFIEWIQLRLGYFENINTNDFIENVKNKDFVSDGIRGSFNLSKIKNPLEDNSYCLYPDILLKKNEKFLELYYKNMVKSISS
jgi:hypothetical protein